MPITHRQHCPPARSRQGNRSIATSAMLAAVLLSSAVRADPGGGAPPAAAAEPLACRAPISAAATQVPPDALRAAAKHCQNPAVATLLRNRAEHAEQLRRLGLMSQLLRHGSNTDQVRLTQCRVYTALAEAFAERAREDGAALEQVLAELNLAYQQAIYIALRTIQGHEHIVGLPAAPR